MKEPVRETRPEAGGSIHEYIGLFGWSDVTTLMLILLVGSIVVHETRDFESTSPYATSFFYALTNVAQVIAPLLAVAIGAGLWLSHRGGVPGPLLKGTLILSLVLAISLLLLPFAESIYELTGIWQGIATSLILLTLWSLTLIVSSVK